MRRNLLDSLEEALRACFLEVEEVVVVLL